MKKKKIKNRVVTEKQSKKIRFNFPDVTVT